ncbi:MAG: DUF922 domain-containing protein [Sphingomicrobium sp.]
MLSPLVLATAFIAQMGGYSLPATRPVMPVPRTEAPAPVAATPPPTMPQGVPGRALKDVPNLTIRYYDVAGKNLKAVVKTLGEQRPKDSSGRPITAATNWKIATDLNRRTTDGQCKIIAAHVAVTATADLPRLLNAAKFPPRDLLSWQVYLASLEITAARRLWFVHDHAGDVEKALLASSYAGAEAAGAAAIESLRVQSAAF